MEGPVTDPSDKLLSFEIIKSSKKNKKMKKKTGENKENDDEEEEKTNQRVMAYKFSALYLVTAARY